MQSQRQNNDPFDKSSRFDWATIIIYMVLVLFGWISIYAAVYNPEHSSILDIDMSYGRQVIWISLSLIVAGAILLTDPKFLNAFAYVIYGAIIISLLGVLVVGSVTSGAKAWFEIGPFKFQPAEFAKFGAALALAKYLGTYEVNFKELKTKVISFAIFLLPMALILLQNDTGSALVFSAFILVLYREGLNGIWLAIGLIAAILFILTLLMDPVILIGAIVLLGIIIYFFIRGNKSATLFLVLTVIISVGMIVSVDYIFNDVLLPHQTQRINVLLGKEIDLKGAGYNVHQSKIAIGSGGFFGKGFLQGTQTKFDFVPEQETDFIFCTIGEEWGFVGTFIVISLFIALFVRIINIAERQKTKFNRIYAYSVACILFFHFAVNISMTIGLFPVIGIPLPFFSYGGSSLLGFTILLFIMIRLDANRFNEMKRAFDY